MIKEQFSLKMNFYIMNVISNTAILFYLIYLLPFMIWVDNHCDLLTNTCMPHPRGNTHWCLIVLQHVNPDSLFITELITITIHGVSNGTMHLICKNYV